MKPEIARIDICDNGNVCQVLWNDDHLSRFHAIWLRFNCNCRDCFDPEIALSKMLDILDIPENIFLKEVASKDEKLYLEFGNERISNHSTYHMLSTLRSHCYCDKCLLLKVEKCDVITKNIEVTRNKESRFIPIANYEAIVEDSEEEIFKWLKAVIEFGVCIVKNVPTEPNSILKAARKIAYLDETNYGTIFNVVPNKALNTSNTEKGLPLHQDLCQYENAVGVQMLHALKYDDCVIGGTSTIVDAFEAAEILREESPNDFQALVEIPVIFSTIDYKRTAPNYPVYLRHQRPHIALDYFGKIVGVNWSPSTLSPLQVKEKDVTRYFKANRKFLEIIGRKDLQYRFRMKPGDMVCFNNRRMLHARDAFSSNGGERHLQGVYLKLDELKSRYVTLAKKLNIPVTSPKVGNNSSL